MTLEKAAMTFPARRILVPDDLTPASRSAWAWARRFAARRARLESLFVYPMPPAPVEGLPSSALAPADAERIELSMREARAQASEWRVEPGDVVSVILRRARRADLIVMGAHCPSGAMRLLHRSVSEAVAREAPAPLLVVREDPAEVRTVLAPMNLESYADRGLELAAGAAAHLGAALLILHVVEPGARRRSPRGIIETRLSSLPAALLDKLRPRIIVRNGKPIEVILEESRRHGLLVLTAHRKSLLGDLVIGTTVERVMRHAAVPVLAAPSL